MENSYIDDIVSGYLEAAEWADRPEGSLARFPASEIEKAREQCAEFIRDCGGLFEQAMQIGDYDAVQFGRDFWLTRCGHGVGFWDRNELETPARETVTFLDRNGKTQAVGPDLELGRALSVIAYGDSGFISRFAYPSVTAYRGWLYIE